MRSLLSPLLWLTGGLLYVAYGTPAPPQNDCEYLYSKTKGVKSGGIQRIGLISFLKGNK